MKISLLAAAAAISVSTGALLASAANATTVILTAQTGDAPWTEFTFEGAGQPWDFDFQFAITGPAVLQVTDAYYPGDIFDVVINGVDAGQTTAVAPNDSLNAANFYDSAFISTNYSHGAWNLAAGDYTVTGTAVVSPHEIGGAAIRLLKIESPPVDPPIDPPVVGPGGVPEPASWALMITGFFGLGSVLRARRLGLRLTA